MSHYIEPELEFKQVIQVSNALIRRLLAKHLNKEGYAFAELRWEMGEDGPRAELDAFPIPQEAYHATGRFIAEQMIADARATPVEAEPTP